MRFSSLLRCLTLLALLNSFGGEKAPYRVLYNNDTTNLESCESPYHKKGAKFTLDSMAPSIDEAVDAGADAIMLSPGLTYVPLWQSRVYPPKAHFEWFRKTFPNAPKSGFGDVMLAGGDLVAAHVARCRERGVAPFVSLRLNDYHLVEFLDLPEGATPPSVAEIAIDRFRREHPQWRLTPVESAYKRIHPKRDYNVMNFAVPEVRARLLRFVDEICAYDIDGIEIDFLRHFRLFNLHETDAQTRRAIVADFLKNVRALLDKHAKDGRVRRLCVRIPAYEAAFSALGIDIETFARVGVDMFNVSANYYTLQQGADYAALRARAPDKAFYWEMTHVTVVGPDPKKTHNDSTNYRRTTDAQFCTTAYLAYRDRYDGVSLFNFQYYRDYENQTDVYKGPFLEPPFGVIKTLADPDAVARAPQHYFFAPVWQTPYGNKPPLPASFKKGAALALTLRAEPPRDGWQRDGVLRLQTNTALPADAAFTAQLNGVELAPSDALDEPYPSPYRQMCGTPETLRAWSVPRGVLRPGDNALVFTPKAPTAAAAIFVDLSMP